MQINDKKALVLALKYIDDVVNERIESRLSKLESVVESSPLIIKEDGELFYVEGPEGARGPRGFAGQEGPEGKPGIPAHPSDVASHLRVDEGFISLIKGPQGPAGKDASPELIANALKEDALFIESIRGDVGPEGPQGQTGKDASPLEVAQALRRSKVFIEEVRGPRGDTGEPGTIGPQGPAGISLEKLFVTEEGVVSYTTSDGRTNEAGAIQLPKFDDSPLKTEISRIKEDLKRIRVDVSSQISRSVMAAAGSSGGGEVRLEFLDDFDRPSKFANPGGPVYWDDVTQKFKVYEISIHEIVARIQNIEDYLQINIPPFPSVLGPTMLSGSLNDYLAGNGDEAVIERGTPLDLVDIYSIRVTDPAQNNLVMESSCFIPIDSIKLYSNTTMEGYWLYLAYIKKTSQNGPWPIEVKSNSYLSADSTKIEIPYATLGIYNLEAWRVSINNEIVELQTTVLSDRIIFESNTPMWGAKINLMVNKLPTDGSLSTIIPLTGTRVDIDLVSRGISSVLNYAAFDSVTSEQLSYTEYLSNTTLSFESTVDMIGSYVKLWYN